MEIRIELTDREAQAFAQFLKRVIYDTYRGRAVTEVEAFVMQDAGERVRIALLEAGFSPR